MRTEYIQGPGPGGMSRVLVLRGSEWECLKNRPQQVGEAERVAAQRAKEQREELKNLSKAMTQDWEGTVEHIRWRSVEANRARREHDAAERNKRLNSLRNRRAEDKKKLIAECKKLIFYDRDHAKSLNKALLFSETLREREAQVQFDKYLKGLEKKRENEYAETVKKDAEEYEKERCEDIRKRHENKLKHKEELLEQLREKDALAEEEEHEKERERQDLKLMKAELDREEALRLQAERDKQRLLMRGMIESLREEREVKERAREEEEIEDSMRKIYSDVKRRVTKQIKEKEQEIQENLAARAQKMGEVVGAIKDTRDAEENEAIRKAIAERELKESERLTREAEYRRSLVEEKKQVQREYVASETLRKAQERHLLKWDMIQRFKQEEVDRKFELTKRKERRRVLLDNRNTYKKQMVEVLEMKKQEREMDKLAVQRAAEAWSAADKAFLQYADEVIQDSRRIGRPIEPLQRIVKEYKKRNNLEPKVKLPPLLRSRVPIAQACHPKCADSCSETISTKQIES